MVNIILCNKIILLTMSTTSKKLVILILILTVIVASAAVYISIELNKENDVGPTVTPAASEEITSAEMVNFDDSWDWQEFNSGWKSVAADSTNEWADYVEYALNEGGRYKCDEEIMTVGKEKLYGCDLNALFVLYDFEKYIEPNSISAKDTRLNATLDGLITNSAILQEAEKQNLFELESTFFNSSEKDHFLRLTKIAEARSAFGSLFERTVDFEVVALYFHNEKDPILQPVEVAKQIAKKKMDILYERLKSKEITMEQAGQEIMDDKITGDTTGVPNNVLDELYKENAYMNVLGHKFGERIFRDPVYDDELRSLGEGQISTVRTCRDYEFDSLEELESTNAEEVPFVDSCYIIFKVNKINYGVLDDKGTQSPSNFEQLFYDQYKQNTDTKKPEASPTETTGSQITNLLRSSVLVFAQDRDEDENTKLVPTLQYRFRIKLPDGSVHPLKGALVHQLRKETDTTKEECKDVYKCDGADQPQCNGTPCNCRWENRCNVVPATYKTVVGNYCRYPNLEPQDIDKIEWDSQWDCFQYDSCYADTYIAPYLPISYNSAQAVYGNGDASSMKFYNQTFIQRFPMFANIYNESSMRKLPGAVWQTTLDYTQGGKLQVLGQHNNDFHSGLKSDGGGWGAVNGYNGKQTWLGGEVVHDFAGGNVLHGRITWTLTVSKISSAPKCVGFNIYKEDGSILSNADNVSPIDLNLDPAIKFYAAGAATDADGSLVGKKMSICWSVAGQSETFYKGGNESYVCENLTATQGQTAGSGRVQNTPRTFQGYIDTMLDDAKNPGTKKISAANKDIIRAQAPTKGLVFVYNFYDDTETSFCSSNIAWNDGRGAIAASNGTITVDPNQCAVSPQGRICKGLIKIQAAQNPPVCQSFSLVDSNRQTITTEEGSANVEEGNKFMAVVEASDPDGSLTGKRIDICWSVAGQSEAFYRKGGDAYACESINATDGKFAQAANPAKTFQEYVDKLKQTVTSAESKAIVDTARDKGLIFVTNIFDNSQSLFCSTNLGYNNGRGVIVTGSPATFTNSTCGTAPNGKGCRAAANLKVTIAQPRCGDNKCDPGELCDGTADCKNNGQALPSGLVCRAAGTAAQCTYCGDGTVNGGEECDDGNTNNNDGCSTSCLKPNKCDEVCVTSLGCEGGLTCTGGVCTGEICEQPPKCGDNKCDTGEACDGNIKCSGNGELTAGECSRTGAVECTFCGDGVVQTSAGELCDDGNTNNNDGCNNNCQLPQARCGDGVCDSGERCEGGISCLTNQALASGQICRLDCTYCGDGMIQSGEECDEGGDTANCTASCTRKTIVTPPPVTYTPTPQVTGTYTPVPTLPPTDLDADDIWMYTMGMGLIGLGLIAYKLNLGYKFAGVMMDNGGFEILLKVRNAKRHLQRRGLLGRNKKDFEKGFIDDDSDN
jgi:cysteine-rich repeat protein